jgi:hypothetical protein
MKVGILGTGVVGHDVKMGSRAAGNEKAEDWVEATGARASQGTFGDAAAFGAIVFNCTSGMASLDALRQAGAKNLDGKVLIDVANPLDFSKGVPPSLSVCNTDSLGEQIQREFPGVRVVKALNTMNTSVMVNPSLVPGESDVFIAGNDAAAKAQVKEILTKWFGWPSVIDLGDITAARGTEMLLPIWLRLWGTLKTPNFNFHIARP